MIEIRRKKKLMIGNHQMETLKPVPPKKKGKIKTRTKKQ